MFCYSNITIDDVQKRCTILPRHIYCNHNNMSHCQVNQNYWKEVVKSFTSVVENCVFGGKGLAVQKVEKNKRRDVRNQKLQMKDIYTCIQM